MSTPIDYASTASAAAGWPWSVVVAFALCAGNVMMWLAIFVNPRFVSEALVAPFLIACLISWVAAVVGIVLVCRSRKSPALWVALAVFVAVPLLNIYGFLWLLGVAVVAGT